MNCYVGIDPSINSTGICIWTENTTNIYIVKPAKLNKKEKIAEESISNFAYVTYEKIDTKNCDDNIEQEYYKTLNILAIADNVKTVIDDFVHNHNINKVYIIQEGISYGSSLRTKSIFDLAGLNYLLRDRFIRNDKFVFRIATPSQIKKFASGNGNCKKEVIINLFLSLFPEYSLVPKIDDISDAFFMSMYAKENIS